MTRRILATFLVTGMAFVLAARAQDSRPTQVPALKTKPRAGARPAIEGDPKVLVEDAAVQQDQLRRQFDEFKASLLRLAHHLENSAKPEDKEKAKILKEAITQASKEGIDTKFTTLVNALRSKDTFKDVEQLEAVMQQNQDLRADLKKLIELLLQDDSAAALRRKREETARLLEQLKEIIRKQQRAHVQTEIGRQDNKELKKIQNRVTNDTRALIDPKARRGAEAKKGEGKDGKGGKDGRGEAKNDTKDPKGQTRGEEGKAGKGEGKDGKGAEGKDGKAGEGKDTKSGEGKEGKPGEGKEGKGGEGKDGKVGEGKDSKESKPGEGKSGEGKESKAGEGKDSKAGAGKPGEGEQAAGKPNNAGKPAAGKQGEGKPSAGKPSEGKSGSDTKGKGEGKGESKGGQGGQGKAGQGSSKPGQGKGSGSKGQGGQQGQQSQGKGEGGQQGGQQQAGNKPSPETMPARKKIQDANKYQEKSEEDLVKNDRKNAGNNQEEAIKNLEEARKKLEELLRQLREEEIERLLAQLQARCQRMLALQIAVRDATVDLDKVIQANPDKKPTRTEIQGSNDQAEKEDEIIREADQALKLIEAEGSAVAFAEVFKQVRGDMTTVASNLRKTDTGAVTVTIENDIIETLKEMIEALKKARQDNKNPPKPGPGQSGKPPDQRLIDLLAELKMIRSMQLRINTRTEVYSKQYEGEQVPPPFAAGNDKVREQYEALQSSLKELAARQEKLGRITHDIDTGKNEAK